MKHYVLAAGYPYTEDGTFPMTVPTGTITMLDISVIKAWSQKHDGPVEIEIGYSAYKELGPVKGDTLVFTLTDMPHRSDFVGGEWVERDVGTPEWQMAQFEDARLWDANSRIATIRFRRVVDPQPEASCLTDRELLEDIHAMLKQLTQQ